MHRTAAAALWLASGCTVVPGPERAREIRAHWLPRCPPKEAARPRFELEALGDFDPSPDTHEVLSEQGGTTRLVVPTSTQAVSLEATDGFSTWTGAGNADASGAIDLALFSRDDSCVLFDAAGLAYPGPNGAETLAWAPETRLLLIAGGKGFGEQSSAIATGAVAIDVARGEPVPLEPENGLRARRIGATGTEFGSSLLVAGGRDPGGARVGSADVFDTARREFDLERIDLEQPRADHAAVVLSSGETLLVGGLGGAGAPLSTLEVVSPETRSYRISRLADLSEPRVGPVAIRLTDGRILVAGGTGADGRVVDSVEWLSADAAEREGAPLPLSTDGTELFGRAFIDMPGGGALAVGGCRTEAASPCADPSDEVLWITRDGRADLLTDALDRPPVSPVLVAGAEGRPWLLTRASDGAPLLQRFDPWEGRFVTSELPAPFADPTAPPARLIALDPGLFAWFGTEDGRPVVRGFRHGTRGPYSNAIAPLLLVNNDGTSPDRAVLGDIVSVDGTVTLAVPGAAVVLTDTTYADVELEIDVVEGSVSPLVRLGTSAFGDSRCPWPAVPPVGGRVSLARAGRSVTLTVGSKRVDCPGPNGRVTVSLEAGSEPTQFRSVAVHRPTPD